LEGEALGSESPGRQRLNLSGAHLCTFHWTDPDSDKQEPGDFDVCWEPVGVDTAKLDPVFLDFSNRRKRQKDKYGGEFFPSSAKADATAVFLDFFQKDKYSGQAKGIIKVQFH
jgi:uncharacterized protein DUF6932